MKKHDLDTLFINPSALQLIYQELSSTYAAIETPIWTGLLANFIRNKGYGVGIIDCEGSNLTLDQTIKEIESANPKLIVVVVYGQQPSASTQNMHGASMLCKEIKKQIPESRLLLVGGHIAALPEQTLKEEAVDFVCHGDGTATLTSLMKTDLKSARQLKKVPGLWFKDNGVIVRPSLQASTIAQEDLVTELPGVAYDLLPMKNYRAHNWHCFDDIENRQPYASLYTSLGCPYRCSFCCINAPFGKPSFRYWEPNFIVDQLQLLNQEYGVTNIKIADEMFVLFEKHFLEVCKEIIKRGLKLNIWAYARIDTIKLNHVDILKKAGVNWLVLGIESKSKFVRQSVTKGQFSETKIPEIVQMVQNAGINVHGNYIFGLPDDNIETMQETLDMALELNCEMSNFYSAMAYPGSQLYQLAIDSKWKLPDSWLGYSQHSKCTQPLPTKYVTAKEVLEFRDKAWKTYFTSSKYQELLKNKFGVKTLEHIQELTKYDLKRDLLNN